MRVVLDTNVLISGLMLPQSIPGKIVSVWQAGGFDLALSEPMLEEIARVLGYPKIVKRLKWNEAEIAKYIALLRFMADVIDVDGMVADVPRDPNDSPILVTLLASKADYLVTGDEDLLSLVENYPVLTPAAFYGKIF